MRRGHNDTELQLDFQTWDRLKRLSRGHRFQENWFPRCMERTFCVCDRLKKYAQARILKSGNEMAIFSDEKRGPRRNGDPCYLNWILYIPTRFLLC